jgi:hypothetical protein
MANQPSLFSKFLSLAKQGGGRGPMLSLVCVDERLPRSAVAKVYLQPTKRFWKLDAG